MDYLALTTTFHDGVGAAVATAIPYESSHCPPVAHDFDEASLVANIRDSQQKNQHYRDFTTRAMNAGVAGYHAFLRGRRVTYYGRQGDQHTEWFPGD